ncbi:Phospholipid metabolism protein [Bonamia ostreae]|uniref:Phospholipid metabolism protein n=1 Tax=Bonamia ostreae TaxID=126728 RepID=A0ABV2AFF2_9EUKA
MHFFSNKHIFNYPFNVVASSFWQKYPNSHNTVISMDTFHREFDYENQRLTTYRIARTKLKGPAYLSYMLSIVGITLENTGVERSVIDLREKTLTIDSRNISGSNLLRFNERCSYKQNLGDANLTDFSHDVKIECSATPFKSYIEECSVDMIGNQAKGGLKALEKICENLSKNENSKVNNLIAEEAQKLDFD